MGKNILCTIVTKKRKKKRGFCMELALEIFLLYLLTYNMRRICHPGKWFTDDSRKLTGRFAQHGMIRAILWTFRASKLPCCVSFKLRFNYFIYLVYQLFVWVLLVADVRLYGVRTLRT